MNFLNIIKFKISLVILLQIIYKISTKTSFDYPYSIILPNDNIFIIQKTGIDIYDTLLNKFDKIFEFSGNEEISEEKFSKIAIKYNTKYILSVINDKMFIFNNEGKILYKSEEKINDNQVIYCYSLTFIHVTNNTCDYVIGFFDEDSNLNLKLYRYESEKDNISLLYYLKENHYSYQIYQNDPGIFEFTNKQKLLSCEYMYSSGLFLTDMNFLVCFFNSDNTVGIVTYRIFKNNKIQLQSLNGDYLNISIQDIDNSKDITSIKSETINNRTLAILWWNLKDKNQTRFFIHDLNYVIYKTFWRFNSNKDSLYSREMLKTCINREYETRISLFNKLRK